MNLKIGLVLAMGFYVSGIERTHAHEYGTEAWISGCNNPFSYDPRCWEGSHNPLDRPYRCLPKNFCGRITRVELDEAGKYRCRNQDGLLFACDAIVAEQGPAIEGLPVRLFVEYIDGCHALGACGERGCVPANSFAVVEPGCA